MEIGRRNTNNLRYIDDTILLVESSDDLKWLLMKVEEESAKASPQLNIKKTKSMTYTRNT